MDISNFTIRSKEDLIEIINELGFLPFFTNSIKGFSIEEHIDPMLWFTGIPGPWEWKGPIIKETRCAYGKLFEKKAAYVSPEWFPDLANFRRDGYDFDALYDDGLASRKDKVMYDLIAENEPIISKKLKELGNYGKNGNKGFETIVTRLQRECYIITSDFVYQKDKYGNEYGWGVAEYSTPEVFMGDAFTDAVYKRTPEQSYQRIFGHFKTLFPNLDDDTIERFLK